MFSPETPPDTKGGKRGNHKKAPAWVQTFRSRKAAVQRDHEILPGSFFQSLPWVKSFNLWEGQKYCQVGWPIVQFAKNSLSFSNESPVLWKKVWPPALRYCNLKKGVSNHLLDFYKLLTKENKKILPAKGPTYFLYNAAKKGCDMLTCGILFFSDELEFYTGLSVKKMSILVANI